MEPHDNDVWIIDPVPTYEELWVPPRTGSKRYQRRRAQRWPKGK